MRRLGVRRITVDAGPRRRHPNFRRRCRGHRAGCRRRARRVRRSRRTLRSAATRVQRPRGRSLAPLRPGSCLSHKSRGRQRSGSAPRAAGATVGARHLRLDRDLVVFDFRRAGSVVEAGDDRDVTAVLRAILPMSARAVLVATESVVVVAAVVVVRVAVRMLDVDLRRNCRERIAAPLSGASDRLMRGDVAEGSRD